MPDGERRRRRPAVSCTLCRRRKIRCNRELPCNNCSKAEKHTCLYDNHPPLLRLSKPNGGKVSGQGERNVSARWRPINNGYDSSIVGEDAATLSRRLPVSSTASSTLSNSPQGSSTENHSTKQAVELTHCRIRQPEEGLGQSGHLLLTNLNVQHESRLFGQCQVVDRGLMHKSRLFGQSHWVNGIASLSMEILRVIEPRVRADTSRVFIDVQKCKSLARIIKWQRQPKWPTPPMSDIPVKEVADRLLDCYLRTFESLYRIVHIPTFKRDYDAIWTADSSPDPGFLIQLKLVLAIGAVVYDQKFSLRRSALQWVYEAQTWVSEPEFKAQLSLQFLQTNILLLIARDVTSVGEDFNWISAGALLRSAIYMGLHRDPMYLPRRTTFGCEMRRRLWNTILEISLQNSIFCGGPPFIRLADFDTQPPGNFDDDQLTIEDSNPQPKHVLTQTSVAIALREAFEIRLAIATHLNDLDPKATYEGTLRLDTTYRSIYKALSRSLQRSTSSTGCLTSRFATDAVDFIMRRYHASLHIPFCGPAYQDPAYAFSRKVVIDIALRLWHAAYPVSSSMTSTQAQWDIHLDNANDLARLTVCTSGFFGTAAYQASLILAGEVISQLKEEEGIGPVTLRPDLVAVLQDSKDWSLRGIEAGETNIKGYLLTCLLTTHAEALTSRLSQGRLVERLVESAEIAGTRCLAVLEPMAAETPAGILQSHLRPISSSTLEEPVDDFDYIMPDNQFDFGGVDSAGWLFTDDPLGSFII